MAYLEKESEESQVFERLYLGDLVLYWLSFLQDSEEPDLPRLCTCQVTGK